MSDEKKSTRVIALDHMTVAHIESKLEKVVVTSGSGKEASLTTAHLARPIEQLAQRTQSGSSGGSSSSGTGSQQKSSPAKND
jgi:hypothetical protein